MAVAAATSRNATPKSSAPAANPKLSAEQLAEVKKLRAEGEAFHKAGKHQESVATLGKAKTLLGI